MLAPTEGAVESRRNWSPESVVSGTSTRFALLVFSILVTSAQLFTVLYLLLPGHGRDLLTAQTTCERAYRERVSDLDLRYDIEVLVNDRAVDAMRQAKQAQWACVADENLEMGYWVLGGLTVVLLVAGLLYVVTPLWQQSRPGVAPLQAKRLRDEIEALMGQVGLHPRTVSFVVSTPPVTRGSPDRVTSGLNAVTYGRSGRYVVRLDSGLLQAYGSDREMVRAILLHELAHIRNRDVSIGSAAHALWLAFLGVGTFSTAVVAPLGTRVMPAGELVMEIVRMAVFATISLCFYASVRRLRELHADARAAVLPDTRKGLLQFVAQASRGGIGHPFAFHPTPQMRCKAITTPDAILRAGIWEGASVGWAAMVTATGGVQYGALFMPVWVAQLFVTGAVTVLLAGTIAAVVWRTATLTTQPTQRRHRFPLDVLLGLCCGMLLGDLLGMSLNLRYWGSLGHWPELSPTAAVISTALLFVALLFVATWLTGIADGWPSGGSTAFPRRAWASMTAAGSVVLGPLFLIWLRDHDNPRMITWTWSHTAKGAAQQGWDYWEGPANTWLSFAYAPFQTLQHNPWVLPTLFVIGLVPLLTRGRPPSGPLMMTGLVGGLCLIVGQVIARTLLYGVFPGTVARPGFSVYYIHCQVGFSVLGMAVVGGVLAAQRWPTPAALLAALLAGTISAVALPVLGFDAGEGFGDTAGFGGFVVSVLRPILFHGALAVGVAVLVVRAAQAAVPDMSQDLTSPRLLRYGSLGLAVLAVHMTFAVATGAPSYALPDEPCQAVDLSSVRHLPGVKPSMSADEERVELPADGRRGAGRGVECARVLRGEKGLLSVNVTMLLPADGRTGALRVLYASQRAGECGGGGSKVLTDVGTLAWGGHQVDRDTARGRPGRRSEHVVCVQDGRLFLKARVRIDLDSDTPRPADIDFEAQEVATKTMARLAEQG
ncbi:M48 family metalloprotease [Streptomyces yangpuensis]|uniref:M48 family metalloprotease n=1 Tax=Streptomyces yangpuensis TaxID=1648182 RepID=UPI00382E3C4F